MEKNLKKLDAQFSLFVRISSSDENGYCKCATCGKNDHYKTMQCGHFISRRHLSIRWDHQNTAPQCVSCNIFNQGKQYEFSLFVNKKYGPGTSDKLLVLSKRVSKWGKFEIDALTEHYKKEVEKLKKQKGL